MTLKPVLIFNNSNTHSHANIHAPTQCYQHIKHLKCTCTYALKHIHSHTYTVQKHTDVHMYTHIDPSFTYIVMHTNTNTYLHTQLYTNTRSLSTFAQTVLVINQGLLLCDVDFKSMCVCVWISLLLRLSASLSGSQCFFSLFPFSLPFSRISVSVFPSPESSHLSSHFFPPCVYFKIFAHDPKRSWHIMYRTRFSALVDL